ncbi:MAG: outer membrane lipoprotein carrier protein LolA [Candidatus Cloacimonas sp.]|nr:outer membrane lipoprotein carrier protein LolA [Candidatus Cloacimonadota bacterium]
MRINSISKLIVVTILLFATMLFAERTEEENILDRLVERYENLTSFSVEFTQNNYWKRQNVDLDSFGTLYVSGEQAAIVYREPIGQKVLYDGVYYVIDDLARTIIVAEQNQANNLIDPSDIIKHFIQESDVSITKKDAEKVEITLKTKDEYVAKITVVMQMHDALIESISYDDKDGNRVTFSFKNYDTKSVVDKNIFTKHWDETYSVVR